MKHFFFTLFSFFFFQIVSAQKETTFKANGPDDYRENFHAFIHATIFVSYDKKIEDAALIIKERKIVSVESTASFLAAASQKYKGVIAHDLKGKFIYPSFIDLFSDYGISEVKRESKQGVQYESNIKGAYGWNQAIKPYVNAADLFKTNSEKADELRKNGFGAVLAHQKDGIARGTGAVVTLADDKENFVMINSKAAAFYSFSKGSSTQEYPSSLMGVIALLRQTYLDAVWYKNSKAAKELNLSLEAWNQTQSLPQIFDANGNWIKALRADKVGDEFGVQYLIKGNGTEYQRVDEIKNTKAKFILPLVFPKAYDVENPYKANWVSTEDMRHWELAPANASLLAKAGVEFTFTATDAKDDFLKNLRAAVKHGLSEQAALKALTFNPANWIGIYQNIGSLETGKWANFFIASKSIFDEKAVLYENWLQGKKYKIKDFEPDDFRGTYQLTIEKSEPCKIVAKGTLDKTDVEVFVKDSTKLKSNFKHSDKQITLSFSSEKDSTIKLHRLSGVIENENSWIGKGQRADGSWFNWQAQKTKVFQDTSKPEVKDTIPQKIVSKITFPFLPYGNETLPKADAVLITNATIWTNENDGILKGADILLRNGKIEKIGRNLSCADCKTTDGTNKHITTGIIDEHSHIAISEGVNEGTESSSAEVRIGDVVNSEDINIYRQLAGGVTASQLLHGSANPIGGQAAMIKLKWGFTPEQMKIFGADGFIKFALGENVKQSNWGERFSIRYPQTRMGVEQTYVNYFTKAQEYERNLKANPIDTRCDLELDALSEILNKKRFITCHSYVQSEINMLMHVADSFGFKVNTFTHILEGYKVADKMKAHGANASTFADWWAYKYEVIDAIPHNAAILTKMGINTAINSDDAEMARRLNQEAAKSVKYGKLSEEEAWKTVTLNPAKMLHLDKRIGSIKAGKDADVVIWSDNPLSIYAVVEKTFVDGLLLYDKSIDEAKQKELQTERAVLIEKMLADKKAGAPTQSPKPKKEGSYSCGEDHEHN
jgi:imidazolonepropionase-like amidohydrolase